MRIAAALGLLALGVGFGVVVAQEPGKKAEMSLEEMMKPAAPIEDPKLDWFVGAWTGTSTFMGETFDGKADYEWALGHQFLMVKESYRSPKGSYESIGFMRPEGGEYKSWAFDNHGTAGSCTGAWEGDTFRFAGEDPNMGKYEGQMKKTGPDSMSWTMAGDMDGNGTMDPMGSATLRRTAKATGASGTR
jgi:hypothetical protein